MALLREWLQIHRNELVLYFWVSSVYFLLRSSNILFSNFAETTFLKRLDVAYLPMVYMVNALLTFFSISLVGVLQRRFSSTVLLMHMLLWCGASVAGLRLLIPFHLSGMYFVIFVLKAQYETLLGLQFWTLANDLFDARQSKRIFPLITAAGIIGSIIGSFFTPLIADIISMDNLMVAYLFTTTGGAATLHLMGNRLPHRVFVGSEPNPASSHEPIMKGFKQIPGMIKGSRLIKILILLHLFPNTVLPILNYQFRFAIDRFYATEGGVLDFFGYFMGSLNVVNLIILLFVGRLFNRWGLPTALMFHPINYFVAFFSLLMRFDIFAAMYARLSTGILRTTFNKPARASLFGLLPKESRDTVRAFLRGVVVRVGIIAGSVLILFSETCMHPKFLSIMALVFVGGWILATAVLKRDYLSLVISLLPKPTSDQAVKRDMEIEDIFRGKHAQRKLLRRFLESRGEESLWYAKILKRLGVKDLDDHILRLIEDQDEQTTIGLLPLLSTGSEEKTLQALRDLLNSSTPALLMAVAETANRFPAETVEDLNHEIFKRSPLPEVQAHAVAGLYQTKPHRYKDMIQDWLAAEDRPYKRAGVIAACRSGDASFLPTLKTILSEESDPSILTHILSGLQRLGAEGLPDTADRLLFHSSESVRMAALAILSIADDEDLKKAISLLRDPSEKVHQAVQSKIVNASHQNRHMLIGSLSLPSRSIRNGILQILDTLHITDLDLYTYIHIQLTRGYANLAAVAALERLTRTRERDVLINHLEQERRLEMTTLLRVMALKDETGKMGIIWRGVASYDQRKRANALEALDQILDPSLSKMVIPLLGDVPLSKALERGKERFRIPDLETDRSLLFSHLLEDPHWVTVVLALTLAYRSYPQEIGPALLEKLAEEGEEPIAETAESLMISGASPVFDKIACLEKIRLFEGLSIGELATIAMLAREVVHDAGEVIVRKGAPGEGLYVVVRGSVSRLRGASDGDAERDAGVTEMGRGAFFGEMALIDSHPYAATIQTREDSRFLVVDRKEFMELVHDYPEIPLRMATVLANRLRRVEKRLQERGR